jgi:hypothetical protein
MSKQTSSNGNTGSTQQDLQSWIMNIIVDAPPPREDTKAKK